MSFTLRTYDQIVRDVLTTLTGGAVAQSVDVPPGDTAIKLTQLANRPVRRISHLEGVVKVFKKQPDGTRLESEAPYRFTAADFELMSSQGEGGDLDSIRFREGGRRPVPGSRLTVNYYPVRTDPVPLTDLNVGSVIRTLLETFSREIGMAYLQLQHIYDSAFLETAEATSLDKVVALVGVTRLPSGSPVTRVRFSRNAGAAGQINVPAGTALTDGAGNRYLTLSSIALEPGETSREVMAGGESPGTRLATAGQLNRLEVLIAGISEVANLQDAYKLTSPETDEDLRRRARGALHGVVRGTVDALTFGLQSIGGVKNVKIVEAPNGVPGEIRVEVAYQSDDAALREQVAQAIEEIRPAGIRVIPGETQRKKLSVKVEWTLAGSSLPGAELEKLQAGVEAALAEYLTRVPPGGSVRKARLASLVLADARATDAKVLLVAEGSESEELTLPEGRMIELDRIQFAPPKFEEEAGPAPPTTSTVSAILPVHLAAGVTQANAEAAILAAFDSHLRTRGPEAPLTVDSLAAAIRDDTRFALLRAEVLATVEGEGRFQQLTDGVGAHVPAPNETVTRGQIDLQVREGGI